MKKLMWLLLLGTAFAQHGRFSQIDTQALESQQYVDSLLSRGGADICAEANLAYAALPSTGGTINIAPGTYSNVNTGCNFGTGNKPVALRCGGGAASFAGLSSQGATIISFSNSFTGSMLTLNTAVGADVNGCSFIGSGTGAVGLQLSNTSGGSCVMCKIDNSDFNVVNGTGVLFGQNIYILNISHSNFHATTALSYPSTSSGSGETLNFWGNLFEGPTGTYSTTCINILFSGSFNFYGNSFDRCGMTINVAGAKVLISGGNYENPNFVTTSDFITIGTSCTQCNTKIDNVLMIEDGNGAGRTHLISNLGTGSHLTITGGQQIIGTEAPITSLVNGGSGSSNIFIDLYGVGASGGFTNPTNGGAWVQIAANEIISAGGVAAPAYVVGNQANILFNGATFAQLGTPTNGSIIYCSDCKNVVDDSVSAAATCVSGGHGTMARRENGAWRCN